MTIRRFPLEDGRGPLEAPEPDGVIRTSIGLFERFRGQIQKKTDSQLVRKVLGCDGRSSVTAYRGDCQDDARAINGGGAALGIDLGNGVIVPVAADLGRSYVASSGYQGDGLASGAFPAPTAATAVDLALDPIDTAGGVAISGEAADANAGADLLGATVAGKVGDSKRLFVCYGELGGGIEGAGLWDDVLSGTETAITGLSVDPMYVGALGGGKYAVVELYNRTVSLIDGTAETGTAEMPVYAEASLGGAFCAPAFTRDLDTMAVVVAGYHSLAPDVPATGMHIGTNMLTTPSWATIDLDAVCDFQVYGLRSILFDDDGNLWAACRTVGTEIAMILVIEPPYTGVTQILTPSWSDPSGSWRDPIPLAISRDGRYVASGVHVNQTLVDIWRVSTRARLRTLSIPIGYTDALPYGGMQFGPDGRLFAGITRDSDSHACLAVWTDFSSTPEIIDLGATAVGGWLSVSGDGQCVVVTDEPTAGTLVRVQPPYTAAGATVDSFVSGGGTREIQYQFEFDPSEAYLDADMTLSADVTTADVGGQLQSTIRLDYRNEDIVDAFGIIVTLPVAGRSVVSVSDDGIYDSVAEVITWFFPALGVGAGGYVTAVLVSR